MGLDPIQIREVRRVDHGQLRHTVLLLTHIMPEVEAVYARVLVIAKGRIAIDDQIDRVRVEVSFELEVNGPVDAVRRP